MRKSPREIETALDDLDGDTSDEEGKPREEYVAEARAALEAGGYDNRFSRILDAYMVATEDADDWELAGEGIVDVFAYVFDRAPPGLPTVQLGESASETCQCGVHVPKEEREYKPVLPAVPTDAVEEALAKYGEEYGVDAEALKTQHGDEWLRVFYENVCFESRRQKAEELNAVWKPEKVEATIRQWRTAYKNGTTYGPGSDS